MRTIVKSLTLGLMILTLAPVSDAADSPYPLEILQPAPNLDERNRYYKAYPGINYEVQIAAVGGQYPYRYSVKGPTGMIVDSRSGVVSWPNPVVREKPYPVSVSVKDYEHQETSVSWQIRVTKEGFIFVDASNGRSSGSGSIDDPLRTFEDVYGGKSYEAKWSGKNKGKFAYFRNGVYELAGYTKGRRNVQYTNNQPVVLMATPGHRPVLDMSMYYLHGNTKLDNLYVEGFEVGPISGPGNTRFAFRVPANSNHVTFRNNTFRDLDGTNGSFNQSAIMMSAEKKVGTNWSIVGNTFENFTHAYGVLGYTVCKVLVANNRFFDFARPGGHAIGPKIGTAYWFIRANEIESAGAYGIWLWYGGKRIEYGHIEVSFNLVLMESGRALSVNEYDANSGGPSYIFRNTFVGDVLFANIDPDFGPITFKKNVVVSPSSEPRCKRCTDRSRIVEYDNLMSGSGSSLVDYEGNLQKDWAVFLGERGHQLSNNEYKHTEKEMTE